MKEESLSFFYSADDFDTANDTLEDGLDPEYDMELLNSIFPSENNHNFLTKLKENTPPEILTTLVDELDNMVKAFAQFILMGCDNGRVIGQQEVASFFANYSK